MQHIVSLPTKSTFYYCKSYPVHTCQATRLRSETILGWLTRPARPLDLHQPQGACGTESWSRSRGLVHRLYNITCGNLILALNWCIEFYQWCRHACYPWASGSYKHEYCRYRTASTVLIMLVTPRGPCCYPSRSSLLHFICMTCSLFLWAQIYCNDLPSTLTRWPAVQDQPPPTAKQQQWEEELNQSK